MERRRRSGRSSRVGSMLFTRAGDTDDSENMLSLHMLRHTTATIPLRKQFRVASYDAHQSYDILPTATTSRYVMLSDVAVPRPSLFIRACDALLFKMMT